MAKINNTKHLLLLNIGYYDEALKIFNQSLQNLKKVDSNHLFIGEVLYNIGFLYLKKEDDLEAIKFFDQSIALNQQIKNKARLAQNYFERAVAYKNLSNYHQAKTDAKLFIKKSEHVNDFPLIVNNLNLLAIIYLNFDNYKNANQLLSKGLELSVQHNLSQEISTIYKSLSRLAEESKNYNRAFLVEKSYNQLYDSLYNKDRYIQLPDFRVYYGAKQKQNENIALIMSNLNKEIKIQNKNYFSFYCLLVLTAYLLWIIFKRSKKMDKTNTILSQQNE